MPDQAPATAASCTTPSWWEQCVAKIANKPVVRMAVVGSRHCTDAALVEEYVQPIYAALGERLTLLSGAANGVDTLVRQLAQKHGIFLLEFPANWRRYGRAAGPIRNQQLVQAADVLLAFVAPTSKGTRNAIALARHKGIPAHVVSLLA